VIIPGFQKFFPSLYYDSFQFAELVSCETARFGQRYVTEPKLCHLSFPTNMDVRRFVAFVAVEKESACTHSGNVWHARRV